MVAIKTLNPEDKTTIRVSRELADRINALKIHPRQASEEIIEQLIVKPIN